jgi:hypothetical protein
VQLALLFSLFVDATILPSSESERKIDFLCEAAWAIQSSLDNRDMGVQLAVRLLLPYAMTDERLRETVGQLLDHYSPSTEQYARTLVVLCRPLIERSSMQIMQACTSVLLELYRRQMKDARNVESAVLTLVDGTELEALVLPDASLGACYQTLARTCLKTVENLLACAVAMTQPQGLHRAVAQAIVTALQQNASAARLQSMPDAVLVAQTLHVVDAIASHQYTRAICLLSEALSQNLDALTGNTTPRNLYWHFLVIAKDLIVSVPDWRTSFDKNTMVVLMETLTRLATISPAYCPYSTDTVTEMENAFAQGLARAFVVDNSRKMGKLSTASGSDERAVMQTSTLDNYSLREQEKFVQDLLEGM